MNNKSTRWLKYAFVFSLVLTVYYTFVWFALPFFADPQMHRFDRYHRLWNWDLAQHARGDFDNDQQEDLISFTGCAFLSAVDSDQIPESRRCTATGIADMTFKGEETKVGQKYIQVDKIDLNLGAFDHDFPIFHSYLGKDTGENWRLFVQTNGTLHTYEIQSSGMLQDGGDASFANQIDEYLYFFSSFFFLLAIPLAPFAIVFSTIFDPLRPVAIQAPVYEVITLLTLTIILFTLWKRSVRLKTVG